MMEREVDYWTVLSCAKDVINNCKRHVGARECMDEIERDSYDWAVEVVMRDNLRKRQEKLDEQKFQQFVNGRQK